MNLGLITTDVTAGQVSGDAKPCTDFESRIYILQEKKLIAANKARIIKNIINNYEGNNGRCCYCK